MEENRDNPDRSVPGPIFHQAVVSAVDGRALELVSLLDRYPGLVHSTSGPPFEAKLMHYAAAANGVEDELQRTPANAVEIVELLLDRGAEPDPLGAAYGGGQNATPLCLLVSSWHPFEAGLQPALVRALVQGGARVNGLDDDGMPLATALVFGYTRAAEALVEVGARVDNVFFAAGLGDLSAVEGFFSKEGTPVDDALGSFVSPMLGALKRTAAEIVQEAFHFAVSHRRKEVAEWLLARGATVDGTSRGHHRERPAEQAQFLQRKEMVLWLCSR